jgi:hypothetical protein
LATPPFNPLDKRNLGKSVANGLLQQTVGPLPPSKEFSGAGVYAIYYFGDFKPYQPVAERNRGKDLGQPIYVGKAVPKGSRKGGFGLSTPSETVLFGRVREHAKSINAAENLKLTDFSCRYLVTEDIWIPLGESLLIEWFQPLWNVLITGFGIHAPGAGRKKQVQSNWDTLHPGRGLAFDLPPNPRNAAELQKMIADFFAGKLKPAITPEQAVTEDEEAEE